MTPPTSRDKILVLAAVCLAGLMLPFSFTGPAVATPAIARAFGGSTVALNWVVNIFILAFGSCVMAAGALADQLGRKRVFRIGVIWFTLASLLMSFAPNLFTLNLLRAVQGVAAAATMSGVPLHWRRNSKVRRVPAHSVCSVLPSASVWHSVRCGLAI